MLRNICRRGRLRALFQEGADSVNTLFRSALDVFRHSPWSKSSTPEADAHLHDDSSFNGAGTVMEDDVYTKLLGYLQGQSPHRNYRHKALVPHPLGTNFYVVSNYAQFIRHMMWKTRPYSIYEYHAGNSSISFLAEDGSIHAGFIHRILKQSIDGKIRTFVVVNTHPLLSPEDQMLNPYAPRPGFQATVVYDSSSHPPVQLVIEPEKILGHVAFRRRPSGTFGIRRPILIIINSLHRDR